jgi:uncharacterized membrane protein YeaQ/YmgE (transglycosylase-associated protein family)
MSLIGWLVIAPSPALARRIVEGYGFGLIGNIVVGILGACICGIILPRLGIIPESTMGNFVAATLGAVLLLFVLGLLKRV